MRCDASSWLCGGHVSVAITLPTTATPSPSSSFICKATGSCCTSQRLVLLLLIVVYSFDTSRPWYNPVKGRQLRCKKLNRQNTSSHIEGEILSERWGNAPVVLCGDFNSTPQV
ncbi:hypothetical protein C1H46_028831 [Malus baccata]|uniref:Endonuclease/exonuclease/phosphatase domain-containing protein n=1 Tax=Malus baccata TaxID=106549 RepID=A0A540LGQ2_MALBA|nr:hypothetical protein C1H46_028831 [Malus baccata]